MAVTSHRIHTIHGAFGAPSCFGPSTPLAINPAQASSFTRVPNVCAPRARPFRAVPGAGSPADAATRTAPASASSASSAAPSIMGPSSGSRPRRTSLSFSNPTPSRRAPPPPPAPAERTASALQASIAPVVHIPVIEDPFADTSPSAHDDDDDDVPLTPLPIPPTSRSSLSARTRVSTYTAPASGASDRMDPSTRLNVPPGLAQGTSSGIVPSAKDMRGRLVASVLLSRGSGRPLGTYLRRRLSGQEHVYVKSGLSQLVAAAA
ncbi:hypothetical protein BD414DRAFT_184580 [Trametes punicea]|nr:hypothetical protein BD414DRAFT_184580 [Trametes punicea]